MPETPPQRLRLGQVLLGLFVVWQLLFLVVSNATHFLGFAGQAGTEERPLGRVLSAASAVTDGWIDLTGQGQNWRLFAPMVPVRATFVTAELGTPWTGWVMERLNEPADPGWYFHPPGPGDRLWHAEKELAWPLVAWDPDAQDARDREWRRYLRDSFRPRWRAYRNYLAWRLREFQRDHPDDPPRELFLRGSVYFPSAGKEQPPGCQATLRLLRWRPSVEPFPAGCLPLETEVWPGIWHFLRERAEDEVLP
jgi:hypothetical protein